MDRLTSMDVFASIVANGSFAGAARQAQVSPTVVSKHVQALENWLGVKLLNRSTRRVALTEAVDLAHGFVQHQGDDAAVNESAGTLVFRG